MESMRVLPVVQRKLPVHRAVRVGSAEGTAVGMVGQKNKTRTLFP